MNDIRPFDGLRFDESVVGPLGTVLCPPYDIISAEGQLRLLASNSHNAIRLEFGLEYPGDSPSDNRYTRAASTLQEWIAEGALKAEAEPALYIYEQQFSLDEKRLARRGVLGSVRLTEWDEGVVLPHEETMAGPKADRLQLMRATACNFSPLFLMYDDPDDRVSPLVSGICSSPATAVAATGDGQIHRLWVVRGDEGRSLAEDLRQPQLYMADGHHRYETALAYRAERRAADPTGDQDAPCNFALMLLVDAKDPGLVVLPTHRLIRCLDQKVLSGLEAGLGARFDEERVPAGGMDRPALAAAMSARMAAAGEGVPTLGLYMGGDAGARILRLRRAIPEPSEGSRLLLDVDVLHDELMAPLLGVGQAELAAGTHVTYVRDAAEALAVVDRGDAQLALLLNPTRVQQVLETARAHGKMPQKSTYFYPKAATGLVFHSLR